MFQWADAHVRGSSHETPRGSPVALAPLDLAASIHPTSTGFKCPILPLYLGLRGPCLEVLYGELIFLEVDLSSNRSSLRDARSVPSSLIYGLWRKHVSGLATCTSSVPVQSNSLPVNGVFSSGDPLEWRVGYAKQGS